MADAPLLLESFKPFSQSRSWALSNAYWQSRGERAFYAGDVPYIAVNDGRLATDLAGWFAGLPAPRSKGPIRILELGGGGGLFAALFLEALKDRDTALWSRVRYTFTDASASMVESARSLAQRRPAMARAQFERCDAATMTPAPPDARHGFDLIIANYLLDVLPLECLYWNGARWYRLETNCRCLPEGHAAVGRRPADLKRAFGRGDLSDEEQSQIAPYLIHECRYRPLPLQQVEHGQWVSPPGAEPGAPGWRIFSQGALHCLSTALSWCRPTGAISIQDYSCSDSDEPLARCPIQQYGGSLSTGVNLNQVERLVASHPGWTTLQPGQDSGQLLSRMICREDHPGADDFVERFDGFRRDHLGEAVQRAREAILGEAYEDARFEFTQVLKAVPKYWHALERYAAFHVYQLHQPEEGCRLAEKGLTLHDSHPALWNTYGDALKECGRHPEALNAFDRALEFNPSDPRAHYNRALVLQVLGRYPEALESIARALHADTEGSYRAELHGSQEEILVASAEKVRSAYRREINRFAGFRDVPASRFPRRLPTGDDLNLPPL